MSPASYLTAPPRVAGGKYSASSIEHMRVAAVDLGTNSTRLLVADVFDGSVEEVSRRLTITRLGEGVDARRRLLPLPIARVRNCLVEYRRELEQLGAERTLAVATSAVRDADNGDAFLGEIEWSYGFATRVLSGEEEARMTLEGVVAGRSLPGETLVVDVGGGSTELVVGTCADGPSWSTSFRVGSGFLAEAYLRSDPPAAAELEKIRQHVAGAFEGLKAPQPPVAYAVGGSAGSLRRLVGAVLDPDSLERGLRVLSSTPAADVARRFELDAERVKLLPAGMLLLEEASRLFGVPLRIGRGGLREGVILEELARLRREAA
jgi:exopolyphosphatase / guanosine-5'-triphosphate,3'-diphosphate pyrophosphatase